MLERLDQLEQQNTALLEEIRQLRNLLQVQHAGNTENRSDTQQREEMTERRVEEQAQTKVEASQRFPVQLTGTALFNAFANGAYGGTAQDPVVATLVSGPRNTGASFRQTILGLRFQGPQTLWGGTVSGSVYMDFFGGSAQSLNHLFRLRLATIQVEWPNTTFAVGQDKPIVSRREPDSFAQVGVSPLTGAGNPWLWQPQARLEQRFVLSERNSVRAEAGIFQTSEENGQPFGARSETARPAFQTRVAFRRQLTDDRRLEIAPVFHTSTSHINGRSLPSRLYGFDWLWQFTPQFELKGLVFQGTNFANLGALGGISLAADQQLRAIRGNGGWLQLQYQPTSRLKFHLYGGDQDDNNRDLTTGSISRNRYAAANVMYLFAPNVIGAFEFGQNRTDYLGLGRRLNNHYDVALGYLF